MNTAQFSNPFFESPTPSPTTLDSNWGEILLAAQEENQFWSWLGGVAQQGNQQVLALYGQYVRDPLVRMINAASFLSNYDPESASEHHSSEARGRLAEFQNALGYYLVHNLSSHATGAQIVGSIKDNENFGPSVAAGAFLALLNQNAEVSRPSLIQGIVLYVSRIEGWSQQGAVSAASALKIATAEIVEEAKSTLSKLNDAAVRFEDKFNTHLTKFNSEIDAKGIELNQTASDLLKRSEEAISNINNTRASYTQYMELESAVLYWKKAAELHKERHMRATMYIALFIVVAVVIANRFFSFVYHVALSGPVDNHLLSIVLGGGTIALATVLVWTARVLVRIYLSEKHMWSDAEERSVMVKTYLALISEGKLTSKERMLVLSPIFRNMSDGIVKDDGAPPLSFASWISGRS